jgi:predicted XRE-type DNA-binding protein
MRKKAAVSASSGNVFADAGLVDADERLAKAGLAHSVISIIKSRGMNQTAAGRLLGIDQPKISALMRGQISGFSTERLFRFLNALGRDVEIVIKSKPRSRRHGEVHVVGQV